MANREKRGLNGRIEIEYDWEESSSGHVENCNSIELVVENNKIVLKETRSHVNFSKSSETRKSHDCIEIDASTLMRLIRENGKKVPEK